MYHPILLFLTPLLFRTPEYRDSNIEKKSGLVKVLEDQWNLDFSIWLPVLQSGKGPKVFLMSVEIQWNLYKATTKFCGLSRQVVSHDMENKHDFVKTLPDIWLNHVFLVKISQFHYRGSTVAPGPIPQNRSCCRNTKLLAIRPCEGKKPLKRVKVIDRQKFS